MLRKRLLLRVVSIISGLVCLLVLGIRVQQYAFRLRAERLISDIRLLQYGKTTFTEAQQILEPWDPHYNHGEAWCRAAECQADVATGDVVTSHLRFFFENHQRLIRLYRVLGGRPAEAAASVRIRNARVAKFSYSLMMQVPAGKTEPWADYDYTLIGTVGIGETDQFGQNLDDPQHPTYRVGWPSGCEICVAIDVSFRPEASSSDVQRLSRFDFSCLSRWFRPCREKSDILPEAFAQSQRDARISTGQ
jgi:hypothetical protein